MENYHEVKPHFAKRVLWFFVNRSLFRLVCCGKMAPLGNWLLRLFGAEIGLTKCLVYGTANIFAPWNLKMDDHSCIGPHVNIYNKDVIHIGSHSIISQGAYLCRASHDYTDPSHVLITKPISVGENVWIAADAFVGMGVTIGDGAVVGARAVVCKNVEPWTVVGGNPAIKIKERVLNKSKNI